MDRKDLDYIGEATEEFQALELTGAQTNSVTEFLTWRMSVSVGGAYWPMG